eukprot:jgi/Psemu1/23674/gm1.23674_g
MLALCTNHLMSWHSLLCKTIKANTALKYLHAVSTFLDQFNPVTDDKAHNKCSPFASQRIYDHHGYNEHLVHLAALPPPDLLTNSQVSTRASGGAKKSTIAISSLGCTHPANISQLLSSTSSSCFYAPGQLSLLTNLAQQACDILHSILHLQLPSCWVFALSLDDDKFKKTLLVLNCTSATSLFLEVLLLRMSLPLSVIDSTAHVFLLCFPPVGIHPDVMPNPITFSGVSTYVPTEYLCLFPCTSQQAANKCIIQTKRNNKSDFFHKEATPSPVLCCDLL